MTLSGRWTTAVALPVAALWAALLLSWSGQAEQGAARRVEVRRNSSSILVSARFPHLFDRSGLEKLDSGFWNRVVARVVLRSVDSPRPLAAALATCRVRYELWEEHYEVELLDHRGVRSSTTSSRDRAIALCTTMNDVPVASIDELDPGRYEVELVAELNPMSRELLESIRQWLRSPRSIRGHIGQGDNVFGSVVSIFVNDRIGRSDRLIRLRSAPFTAPGGRP